MPIATEVVAEQRSELWHKARAGRATASKFATIITDGTGAETYLSEVLQERQTGKVQETFTSKAMQEGIDSEELARLKYELATSLNVRECGFFAHNSLMAGASPDGLVEEDGLVEIKCPVEKTHRATLKSGNIPNQYYWQMMGQMWMTGRKWCDYVSFFPYAENPKAQMFIKRVERDESAVMQLDAAVRKFLFDLEREEQFIKQYTGKGGLVTVTRVSR